MLQPKFTEEFLRFFRELTVNNNRQWFQDHKPLFEDAVVAPMLALIEAMGSRFPAISDQILADPRKSGGSLFRIYRDTRFAKDKTPYKTHAAAQFRHRAGKDAHAPGFYFHADPHEIFLAGGIWQPAPGPLEAIRGAIDRNPEEWLAFREDPAFKAKFQFHGTGLKRPPRGYDVDHPLIEDIKRKDFIVFVNWKPEALFDPDLADRVAAVFKEMAPLPAFVCKALDLPF